MQLPRLVLLFLAHFGDTLLSLHKTLLLALLLIMLLEGKSERHAFVVNKFFEYHGHDFRQLRQRLLFLHLLGLNGDSVACLELALILVVCE